LARTDDVHTAVLQSVTRFEWERIIRRCKLPRTVKLIACVVAQYGNIRGENIRPGLDLLAEDCDVDERTVRRALARLVELGLLERLSHGGGPTRKAATYRLTVPEDLLERVEVRPPEGRSPDTQMSGEPSPTGDETPDTQESTVLPLQRAPGGENSGHFASELWTFGARTPDIQMSTHQGNIHGSRSRSPTKVTPPARPAPVENPDPDPRGEPDGQGDRCPHDQPVRWLDRQCTQPACGDCRRRPRPVAGLLDDLLTRRIM
jgi:hypothetical protein